MKSHLLDAVSACAITFISLSAQAVGVSGQGTWETTLQGRDLDGNAVTFEAYYDTTLDITWLADANVNGQMTWDAAYTWATNLNVNGVTGWRLPTLGPIDGTAFNYNLSNDGTTDRSYNISAPGTAYAGSTASEMAHLFYNTLGNTGFYDTAGVETGCTAPDDCLSNTGPFSNSQSYFYWSGLEYAPYANDFAWLFYFADGGQGFGGKVGDLYALAVHPGDVGDAPSLSVSITGSTKTWVYNPKARRKKNNPTIELVANGVPSGGAYLWEVTIGENLATILEQNGGVAIVQGNNPSVTQNDIEVHVSYSIGTATADATHKITLVRPVHLCECIVGPYAVISDPSTICGSGDIGGTTRTQFNDPLLGHNFQTLYYFAIMDQFGSLLAPSGFGAPPMEFSERVSKFKSNYSLRDGCPIAPRVIKESDQNTIGILKDSLVRDCVFLPENPPDIVTTAEQKIKMAGWSIGKRDFTYFYNFAISQETRSKNLCPYGQFILPFTIVPSFDLK